MADSNKDSVSMGYLYLERETKNTYVYSVEDPNGRKITQYVPKQTFVGASVQKPPYIEVLIQWDTNDG